MVLGIYLKLDKYLMNKCLVLLLYLVDFLPNRNNGFRRTDNNRSRFSILYHYLINQVTIFAKKYIQL